ncbi:2OG-Fe(II) oxygenase [Pseudomonas phage vB_PpuP-IPa-2]
MAALLLDQKLALPHASQLHPDLLAVLADVQRLGHSVSELGGYHLRSLLSWGDDNAGQKALSILTEHGPGIYSFPFLSPDYCRALREQQNSMAHSVNEYEEGPYQIPEVFLKQELPQLYTSLGQLFRHAVIPLSQIVFRLTPIDLTSAQFARYTPENTANGNWHVDRDSDITAVVALSSDHEGGGTQAAPPGLGRPVFVPQLPVGHAMFFLGRSTLHKGERVTKGQRDLLVFWSKH